MSAKGSSGRRFQADAETKTWLREAGRNLAVAEFLFEHVTKLRMQPYRSFDEIAGCHYAAYLHSGLAIENVAKAVLIPQDPTIAGEYSLDPNKLGGRGGYALVGLVERILADLSDKERHLLTKLGQHLECVSNYTMPMNAMALPEEELMDVLESAYEDEKDLLRSLVGRLRTKSKRE